MEDTETNEGHVIIITTPLIGNCSPPTDVLSEHHVWHLVAGRWRGLGGSQVEVKKALGGVWWPVGPPPRRRTGRAAPASKPRSPPPRGRSRRCRAGRELSAPAALLQRVLLASRLSKSRCAVCTAPTRKLIPHAVNSRSEQWGRRGTNAEVPPSLLPQRPLGLRALRRVLAAVLPPSWAKNESASTSLKCCLGARVLAPGAVPPPREGS